MVAVGLIMVGSTRSCVVLSVAPLEVLGGILVVSVVVMRVVLGSCVGVEGTLQS
jgi:hypothetical protein